MRILTPWLAALLVLLALLPVVCMSGEGGPTTCQSVLLLPLPWGEGADTWGWVFALGATVATFVALRLLLRRRESAGSASDHGS